MEATIGFDLRSNVPVSSWTMDRRACHLLRRDVTAVRSVDPDAWVRPPGLPRPAEMAGLWLSLSDLLTAADALDIADAVTVLITALESDEPTEEGADAVGPDSGSCDLLGYDVADWWLLSGLTNCGYEPEEATALAPVWAPLLNKWHLFDDPEDATAFAAVTAERVPEHAPFYAYGIYQLG